MSDRVLEQLEIAGVTQVIGAEDISLGDERVGATMLRAHADAVGWVGSRP